MQTRAFQNEHEAIFQFLKHFNYLNDKNKRAGHSLFNNPQLTSEIEQTSKQLIAALKELMVAAPLDADARNKQFLELLGNAAQKVLDDKIDFAPVESLCDAVAIYGNVVYVGEPHYHKSAHSSGKFEKEFIKGLEAAKPYLNETDSKSINQLIANIKRLSNQSIKVNANGSRIEESSTTSPRLGRS